MKNIIRTFVGTVAIATVAGCGPLAGILANPPVPGMPGAGASAAPGTAASTAPTTTTPTASTAPAATTAPASSGGEITDTSANCKLTNPAAEPEIAKADLGKFFNFKVPNGYNDAYSSEAQVYEAIGKLDIDNWACFQKFYPGAANLYKEKMGLKK